LWFLKFLYLAQTAVERVKYAENLITELITASVVALQVVEEVQGGYTASTPAISSLYPSCWQ
jgi:hypothetical protein